MPLKKTIVYLEVCGLICKDLSMFPGNILLLISSLILCGQETYFVYFSSTICWYVLYGSYCGVS